MISSDQVEKLLGALRNKYPANIWNNAYPGALPVTSWFDELRMYTPEHVRHALGLLRENHSLHPPTAMQFSNLCEMFQKSSEKITRCSADGCPVKTIHDRCILHPECMSVDEDRTVSNGIQENIDLVRYYLFLRKIRPHEIYDPKIWNWPRRGVDGINKYPMADDELAGSYLSRIASITHKACGLNPKYLIPKSEKSIPQYQVSKPSFKRPGEFMS